LVGTSAGLRENKQVTVIAVDCAKSTERLNFELFNLHTGCPGAGG